MGAIVDAECECGYQAPGLQLGCGFEGPALRFPCLCARCRKVVVVDLLVSAACPKCGTQTVPVDDAQPPVDAGAELFSSSQADQAGRRHTLYYGRYSCPKCGRQQLRFMEVGLWD